MEEKLELVRKIDRKLDQLALVKRARLIKPLEVELIEGYDMQFYTMPKLQGHILAALMFSSIDLTVSQICNLIGCSKHDASKGLSGLEAKGYVERYLNNDDRRFVWVKITDEGRKISHQSEEAFAGLMCRYLSVYLTDEDMNNMLAYTEGLIEILSKLDTGFFREGYSTDENKQKTDGDK